MQEIYPQIPQTSYGLADLVVDNFIEMRDKTVLIILCARRDPHGLERLRSRTVFANGISFGSATAPVSISRALSEPMRR